MFEFGHDLQKTFRLFLRAEAHHSLNPSAVVPAAVKDHDLSGGRKMCYIALRIHLRFLAFGRRGQRNQMKYPWTDTLNHRLDRPTLTCAVASLEDNADFQFLMDDPPLQFDQFDV